MNERFVALGDSFTEGVGDADPRLPNGVRGWADLVAVQLAALDSGFEYANLAVRSKRLEQVVEDQVDAAVGMKPGLVSLYAGGNNLLHAHVDVDRLARRFEDAVARLAATGARLLLFTGFDAPLASGVAPLRRRNHSYNRRLRAIAQRHNAMLVDSWCFEKLQERRMWSDDRLHLSTSGHLYMARKVLEVLRVEHYLPVPPAPAPRFSTLQGLVDGSAWLYRDVRPWLVRRLRGLTSGDGLTARWPEPSPVAPLLIQSAAQIQSTAVLPSAAVPASDAPAVPTGSLELGVPGTLSAAGAA